MGGHQTAFTLKFSAGSGLAAKDHNLTKVRYMDTRDVDVVRRFSRLVTQRVGALDERYLRRDRPLGQARVLWEIGLGGCEVGVLRARLGIDSAQLSRTLRALERDGLAGVTASGRDSRVRIASLTASGVGEWHEIEAASQASARSILEPLGPSQQARLVGAMAEVERLLTASMVEVVERAPSDPLARICLRAYETEIEQRFGGHFDPGDGDERMVPPDGWFLVATLQGEPVGCGGLKIHRCGPPEIKRLWTSPTLRGVGLGRRILGMLEQRAADVGANTVRLDTNRSLSEAVALYRSAGYREIPAYNDNPYAHHWFEKDLCAQR